MSDGNGADAPDQFSGDPADWSRDTMEAVVAGILIGHGAAAGDELLEARKQVIFDEFERRLAE